MKILQINVCHYRRGGADVVYLNTGQLLIKKGHEVLNFSQRNKNNDPDSFDYKYFVNQIDFLKLSLIRKLLKTLRFFYSFEAKQNLEKLIINEKPDIAHIHTYKGTLTPSILLTLKKYKVPTVLTLHDYGLLCPHNLFLNGKGEICEKCPTTNNPINCITNKCNHNNLFLSTLSAFEFIFHKSISPFSKSFDKLIAVSKFGLEIHSRHDEYKNKIVHLYNFYPELNKPIINDQKGAYFLFFGRLSSEKGINSLINAWKSVGPDSKLKIVGDGPLMADIKEFVVQNGLSNIEMLGFKQGNELDELIRQASFIVVPSKCYENNPLTIIEAYSNGKPVIGSRIGGISEIVVENKTGYLFEMGNIKDLSEVLQKASNISSNDYQIMSNNSRSFAEKNFSEEKHYESLIQIYKSVIHEKRVVI